MEWVHVLWGLVTVDCSLCFLVEWLVPKSPRRLDPRRRWAHRFRLLAFALPLLATGSIFADAWRMDRIMDDLHEAMRQGDVEAVRSCFSSQIDVTLIGGESYTVLNAPLTIDAVVGTPPWKVPARDEQLVLHYANPLEPLKRIASVEGGGRPYYAIFKRSWLGWRIGSIRFYGCFIDSWESDLRERWILIPVRMTQVGL